MHVGRTVPQISFKTVLEERADDLAFITERVEKTTISKLEGFIKSPFERIEYTDAIKLAEKVGAKVWFSGWMGTGSTDRALSAGATEKLHRRAGGGGELSRTHPELSTCG